MAADEVEAGEVLEVAMCAVLEVMVVVGDELRDDVGLSSKPGNRLVERFDRTPRPPEELLHTRQPLTARGHTRETPRIVRVEDRRTVGEPVQVRRVYVVVDDGGCLPVRRKEVPTETVDGDE